MDREKVTIDGNEATASVAHRINEICAIYPITPSSNMGEFADDWSAVKRKNIWGTVPLVIEMQSEGGASGAVHGALQTGALTTTFTASQGLLLMIPNMFKIAGELTSTVFHVSARTLATHALSIFGDHSDVMAVRQTGWAMMASGSVQEAHDTAVIAQAATLEARVPFLHFFDGFRTSHEIDKIEQLTDDDLRAMIDDELVRAHRARALSPDHPVLRGTAQNPDVFFQARETVNPYYAAVPGIVQKDMDKFAKLTGRAYHLFDYIGAPDAERVVVIMASGGETAEATVHYLVEQGREGRRDPRAPVPPVLMRTLPQGPARRPSNPSPCWTAPRNPAQPASRFTWMWSTPCSKAARQGHQGHRRALRPVLQGIHPGHGQGRLRRAAARPSPRTISSSASTKTSPTPAWITTRTSRSNIPRPCAACSSAWAPTARSAPTRTRSRSSVKRPTTMPRAISVYDSKKSGTMTISHLRFGPKPIQAPYLIDRQHANFVACHQFTFLERYDMLKYAQPGGVFLLNSIYGPDEVWDQPAAGSPEGHHRKETHASTSSTPTKWPKRPAWANASTPSCRPASSPSPASCRARKPSPRSRTAIEKTYGKRGEAVVQKNFDAVDQTLANLHEVKVPAKVTSKLTRRAAGPGGSTRFRQERAWPDDRLRWR